jgi:hypothetical protein
VNLKLAIMALASSVALNYWLDEDKLILKTPPSVAMRYTS